MSMTFSGQVAVVTGAANGIGRATAQAFAAEGLKVVVADLDAAGGEGTVALIRTAGGEATFVRCNVTVESEVKNLMDEVINTYGRLDYAFNNAGISGSTKLTHEITEAEWDLVQAVNVKGVLFTVQKALPLLANHASVILTGSTAGSSGTPAFSVYSASKAAVRLLSQSMVADLASSGIRVNVIAPGVIVTPMTDATRANPERLERFMTRIPAGRLGQPQEIAHAAVFLASDLASFCSQSS